MKSNLNQKISEIYSNFKKGMQKAKNEKDEKVASILEQAEEDYVEKIKKDINL